MTYRWPLSGWDSATLAATLTLTAVRTVHRLRQRLEYLTCCKVPRWAGTFVYVARPWE